ncbi:MAG: ComF family protein [Bacteroidales bacterium]|nr:ComF family protein [Bacteroidales bacterium]
MKYLRDKLSVMGESLAGLFFPRLCPACSGVLYGNESILCLKCNCEFPRTGFHLDPANDTARLFWGRVMIKNAASFFFYQKGSRFQNIIHKVKYHNCRHLGMEMGRWYGHELVNTPFCHADLIHPVPLHVRKQRKRGYNQSELIAKGLSESLSLPMETGLVERVMYTDTQTRKSKYERWSNVEGIFRVIHPEKLKNKHVLLVDDVVTTGSTLEACAAPILSVEGTQVSILTLAYAKLW